MPVPCRATPRSSPGKRWPSGQPGEGCQTAARRPRSHSSDLLICAAGLPKRAPSPPVAQPESRVALLRCLGRQLGASPPGADEAWASPETGSGVAPVDHRIGCPEPCARHDDSPKQRSTACDFWCPTCARCSSRPNFAVGACWPQAQCGGHVRPRTFDMRRGCGRANLPPRRKRASLARHRARGGQERPFIEQDPRDDFSPRLCPLCIGPCVPR